jgi:hypothetical protein
MAVRCSISHGYSAVSGFKYDDGSVSYDFQVIIHNSIIPFEIT